MIASNHPKVGQLVRFVKLTLSKKRTKNSIQEKYMYKNELSHEILNLTQTLLHKKQNYWKVNAPFSAVTHTSST